MLYKQQSMLQDGEEIQQEQVMKLRKMYNTSKAIVRMEKSFVDLMISIISCGVRSSCNRE